MLDPSLEACKKYLPWKPPGLLDFIRMLLSNTTDVI